MKTRWLAGLVVVGAALVGCGGGDGDAENVSVACKAGQEYAELSLPDMSAAEIGAAVTAFGVYDPNSGTVHAPDYEERVGAQVFIKADDGKAYAPCQEDDRFEVVIFSIRR